MGGPYNKVHPYDYHEYKSWIPMGSNHHQHDTINDNMMSRKNMLITEYYNESHNSGTENPENIDQYDPIPEC